MIFQNIDCAIYIRMLSPLILFIYLDNVIDNILKGLNQQFNVMLCNILDLILSIFILYFLLPKIGIAGFIIAIYISEIFNFLISYFVFYKTVKFNFSKKNPKHLLRIFCTAKSRQRDLYHAYLFCALFISSGMSWVNEFVRMALS